MTDESLKQPDSLAVENALLRGALFLTVTSLRRYCEAPHFHGADGLQAQIDEETQSKALEAVERGQALLQGKGRTK